MYCRPWNMNNRQMKSRSTLKNGCLSKFQEFPTTSPSSVQTEDDMILTLNHILFHQEESERLENRR